MDRPRQNDHLGVKKIRKNIRKSPLHLPNFAANANLGAAASPQVQPQVYNIRRNDFKSIVQQLTGCSAHESLPRPPQNNSPKPQNTTRLQRIRPPPLTQINRPAVPLQHHHPHSFMRPPPNQSHLPQGTQQQPMMGQGDQFWSTTAECPISEYMPYHQSSLGDEGPSGNQMQPCFEQQPYMPAHEHRPYMPGHVHRPCMHGHVHRPYMPGHVHRPYMHGHVHRPYMPGHEQSQPQNYMPYQPQPQPQPQHQHQPEPYMMHGSQPQMNMHGPLQPSQYLPPPALVPSSVPRNLPPPQFNGHVPVTSTLPSSMFNGHVPVTSTLPSPMFNQTYGGLPSPRYENFGQLDSLTSQFALPSPTSYPNMFSPRSQGGFQYPQPLTPNFSFSQLAQSGSLGPGSGPPQQPPSPGLVFPLSPGLLPVPSPRWNDY
ncbi:unnamed protein product [Eruca vesicaria subsp. sativa]|uniref:VQ domain-containing protein n=1 Tax=Eruca vesicaria subsp. sativa TaxID=29727 RepID=A0ABC8L521_ERUVS|nr:unnamed protein product [Eruca vesicaria subsp. sativa]